MYVCQTVCMYICRCATISIPVSQQHKRVCMYGCKPVQSTYCNINLKGTFIHTYIHTGRTEPYVPGFVSSGKFNSELLKIPL